MTVFKQLSFHPSTTCVKSSMGIIEAFIICHCYGNKTCNNVDELRYSLFRTSLSNSFRDLPPSKIGLFYHVLRSCFQAGWVCGNTFLQEKTTCVSEFGWDIVTGTFQIKWIDEFNQKTLHNVDLKLASVEQ